MRKCIRCGSTMVEGCGIKVKGGAYGIVLTDNENKWWGGRIGEPKVAICPNCGEVSIYLENRKVKKIMRNETIGCISPISHRLIRAEQASPVCGRSENREQDLFFEWEM